MQPPSMPPTSSWPSAADRSGPAGRTSGSISILAVFLYLLFSVIGLGLIALSQGHIRFSGLKQDLSLLRLAAESGIKRGYEALAERIATGTAAGPVLLAEEAYLALQADVQSGGSRLADRLVGDAAGLAGSGGNGRQAWDFTTRFDVPRATVMEGFFTADLPGRIDSIGTLVGRRPRSAASLDLTLRAAAGHIPLALFPFLIAGGDPDKEAEIRSDSNIRFAGGGRDDARPAPAFAPAAALPADPEPLLKKALQVKLFSPDKLTRAEIRAALGLEMVDEPVPEGVYLIRNSNGLGGVYAQGDLDAVILAVDNGWQDIFFAQGQAAWALKFRLFPGRTVFAAPEGTEEFDRAPLGIIIVDGGIASLGGGTVDAAGVPALQTGDPVPSVLNGVSLTIVSTGRVEISSHLVQEGVRWTDEIPYLKESAARLSIWAGGDLSLAAAGQELQVQASLTSNKTISAAGAGKRVVLAGGLQAAGLDLGGNGLTIVSDERTLVPAPEDEDSPRTAVPVFMLLALRPLRWND
jgi:hypothetical protein